MNEIRQQCERQIDYDDCHLYDGRCTKCANTAIRRGNVWFHTVVTICQADQDPDNDYFKMSDDPLGNCHCTKCELFRKNYQLAYDEITKLRSYKIERRRDA